MKKIEELDLYSDQVTEYMNRLPGWLSMSGSLIIFILLSIIICLTTLIRYPETIKCKVQVEGTHPPTKIVAKTSGRLLFFNAHDNQEVDSVQILGCIDNTAKLFDIKLIKNILDTTIDFRTFNYKVLPLDLQLGQCQTAFEDFRKALNEYWILKRLQPQQQKILSANEELKSNIVLSKVQAAQDSMQRKELNLSRNTYDRILKLKQEKVISNQEMEDKEKEFLTNSRSYESSKENLIHTKINIQNLSISIKQLAVDQMIEEDRGLVNLLNAKNKLKASIINWEEMYLIKSPYKGTVSLFSYWVKNQYITSGTTVLSIISKYNNLIFARLNLPIRNSGKVKIGQIVHISLDAYPAEEYGYIKGQIQNISLVPENHQYLIVVQLPDQLKTTFGKKLHFKNNMEGDAEVVTEKLSLFERIFTFIHAKKNNQI